MLFNTLSRMRTISPSASANAIESGMSVFFIQKPPLESSSKRKIIPASAEKLLAAIDAGQGGATIAQPQPLFPRLELPPEEVAA